LLNSTELNGSSVDIPFYRFDDFPDDEAREEAFREAWREQLVENFDDNDVDDLFDEDDFFTLLQK
jgi:hypothetical protein